MCHKQEDNFHEMSFCLKRFFGARLVAVAVVLLCARKNKPPDQMLGFERVPRWWCCGQWLRSFTFSEEIIVHDPLSAQLPKAAACAGMRSPLFSGDRGLGPGLRRRTAPPFERLPPAEAVGPGPGRRCRNHRPAAAAPAGPSSRRAGEAGRGGRHGGGGRRRTVLYALVQARYRRAGGVWGGRGRARRGGGGGGAVTGVCAPLQT